MTTTPVEEEFRQFIEFGHVFDKATRRYLAHYLKNKLYGQPTDRPHRYDSPQYDYLKETLDRIFADSRLLRISAGNEALANQIVHDTLAWMRKSQQEVNRDNPAQAEFSRLNSWKDRPLELLPDTWYHLTNFLQENYTPEQIDVRFYVERFDPIFRDKDKFLKQLKTPPDEKLPVEILMDDLLVQWEKRLVEKSLAYEFKELENRAEAYANLLYAKADEYEKMMDLVAPFAEEAGRFWDMSRGLWKQTNFDVLSKYAGLLQNEKSIRELADLLGRLREAQTEMAEERYEYAIAKASYRDSFRERSEIGGVYESDNLNYMLPAEAALLGDPATESAFYKRYADKHLLTFRFQGKEVVRGQGSATATREKTRRKEKGPFILCIDASASMEGTPEYVAKVLCFAILKMAAREKRRCYLISFSTGLQTINLLELENSLDQVVKFLSMTFQGGTDVHPPMYEALNMLHTRDYKDADVLMISDFIMYEMQESLVKRIRAEQRRGTQFHCLTVNTGTANPKVVELFDNYWTYHPDSKDIARQLAADLRVLTNEQ
ncbi:MAG: VWA domain-containing protein [Cytophagales bacterium]|nr:VWA domain-containing protein [Cytophagales bacterium]